MNPQPGDKVKVVRTVTTEHIGYVVKTNDDSGDYFVSPISGMYAGGAFRIRSEGPIEFCGGQGMTFHTYVEADEVTILEERNGAPFTTPDFQEVVESQKPPKRPSKFSDFLKKIGVTK